jgi:hypothetical protein
MDGRGTRLTRAKIDAQLQDAAFSNDDGSVAGEDVNLRCLADISPLASGWRIRLDARATGGAAYLDPLYLAVEEAPIHLAAQFDWLQRHERLVLQELDYQHPGNLALTAKGHFRLDEEPWIEWLDVDVGEGSLPALYDTYLQPWLTETAAGHLDTSGRVEARIRMENGMPVLLSADLQNVGIEERSGLFGMEQLDGRLNWSDTRNTESSTLAWQGGHLFRIALGAARVEMDSVGNAVHLVRPARLPVLDGELQVDTFSLEYADDQPLRWEFDGILTPVSMKLLTGALKWPEFGGKLSGVIPAVRYADWCRDCRST